EKHAIIEEAQKKSEEVIKHWNDGLLSQEERYRMNIEVWHAAKAEVEKLIPASLPAHGPVSDMLKSGARGSLAQMTQMAGMKGLIASATGETIEFPITKSMKEGLSPIEYFITTHGSRKGLSDTALNTAKAGYLTRRLFDVAQDVVISIEECGTKEGLLIRRESAAGIGTSLANNIHGRYLAQDVALPSGEVLFKKGHFVSKHDAKRIEDAGVASAYARSPIGCKAEKGLCARCYGADLGTTEPVDLGEAIGTVAAQAIGEPGTQLTMRTFHAGGAAAVGGDITQGLPRVEEIFERRMPRNPAVVSHVAGEVSDIREENNEKIIVVLPDIEDKKGKKPIEYDVHMRRVPLVKVGDRVEKGQLLTDGSADIGELFKYAGKEKTQEYIIGEIVKIYELQGASISIKHIEVIVRQMFSRVRIKETGDTRFSTDDITGEVDLNIANADAKERDKEGAKGEPLVMGILDVSLTRASFLSAASFQNTTRMLIKAAVYGSVDALEGLKENVIIGRLIPAGTGFPGSPKAKIVDAVKPTPSEIAAQPRARFSRENY
ncbi:MAG TPA: DNA-directed RNA polymerase subunit beta', partial [Candidatus Paceibacterota bacterium]